MEVFNSLVNKIRQKYKFVSSRKMSPRTYLPASHPGAIFCQDSPGAHYQWAPGQPYVLAGRQPYFLAGIFYFAWLSHVISVSKTALSAIISFALEHTQKVKRPRISSKLFLERNRRLRLYICDTVAVQGPAIQLPYKAQLSNCQTQLPYKLLICSFVV